MILPVYLQCFSGCSRYHHIALIVKHHPAHEVKTHMAFDHKADDEDVRSLDGARVQSSAILRLQRLKRENLKWKCPCTSNYLSIYLFLCYLLLFLFFTAMYICSYLKQIIIIIIILIISSIFSYVTLQKHMCLAALEYTLTHLLPPEKRLKITVQTKIVKLL